VDTLQAIGDPELRRVLLHARSSGTSITVDELALDLGIHRNVARSRLDRLVAASLLHVHFERRTGRTGPGAGRPARLYSVAPELASVEFPPHGYEGLLGLLISSLPRRGLSRQLHAVGVAFGEDLARSMSLRPARTLPEAVEEVCRALGELGFHAAVDGGGDDEAWIRTATCPLRPLVGANAEAMSIDRGMWTGLVASALEDVAAGSLDCRQCDCLDAHRACRVHVRLSAS
jgi:predicted ArsR family transcriptional regulator